MSERTWATSKDAVPPGHVQITVYDEKDGRRIATVFDAEAAPQIAAMPKLLAALREIAERGPVQGYKSAGALMLRLVATQSIARAALREIEL